MESRNANQRVMGRKMDKTVKTTRVFLIFLSFLFILVFHFSHGSARAFNSVVVGKYRVQVLTEPDPPVTKDETKIILKVIDTERGEPVRNALVRVDPGELYDPLKVLDGVSIDPSRSKKASEIDEFGNYMIRWRFDEPGDYQVKVLLDGDGQESYLAGFPVTVSAPEGMNWGLSATIFIVLFAAFITLYYTKLRRPYTLPGLSGFNLLDIHWVRRLFEWKYIQTVFQVPLAIVFLVLIILGFADVQDGGRNLSTKLIWTIWWAGIIFTFVIVGRLWCFMCPMGAISEWVSRIFKPKRLFPARMRNVWIANILFVLLTWLDVQLGVVRSPIVTASVLLGLTLVAVTVALFYQRRTFCRYLCPIGGLIGIYSMFSAVELRSKDCDVCSSHKRKDCYLGNDNGHGCPMFEIVPAMDSNNGCNFCGECIKACPKNNITLRFRMFFKDAWTTRKRRLDEAALAIVLVGVSIFVTGDMLEPWGRWMESVMSLIPADLLGIKYRYTLEVITKSLLYFLISLLLIPGLMIAASYFSNRLAGDGHRSIKETFITFGYMFIPVGLSMHLAHNTAHLLNESGGVVPAFQRTVKAFTPFNLGEPDWLGASAPLVNDSVVYMIQMTLFVIFFIFSLVTGYKLAVKDYKDSHTAFRALIPMVMLSVILMIVNIYLLNLPMAPRHIH